MLICVLSLCCGGVAADVRFDFALLPLYGVRLVTDILIHNVQQSNPDQEILSPRSSIQGYPETSRYWKLQSLQCCTSPQVHNMLITVDPP